MNDWTISDGFRYRISDAREVYPNDGWTDEKILVCKVDHGDRTAQSETVLDAEIVNDAEMLKISIDMAVETTREWIEDNAAN